MTLIDVLDVLPANHPRRPELIAILQNLVRGLAKYQDSKTGLWYQVIDKGSDPANWLETSSSSMYSYVISMAVRKKYVDKSYAKAATKGYRGVLTKVSLGPDGLANIADICEGTNVGDLAFYYNRKRNVNDFHGLGAFLIMNEYFLTGASAMELTDPHHNEKEFASLIKQETARPSKPAEVEDKYPEPTMFGPSLPSHGFFIRHAKNIQLSNVEVVGTKEDSRPAFVLQDMKGADFFRVRASRYQEVPTVSLKRVSDFGLAQSRPLADTFLEMVEDRKL